MLPVHEGYDPHFEPDAVPASSDGSLLMRPSPKLQLPFRKSSSSQTFPSSNDHSASQHSGSWPPQAAQRMQIFGRNPWPDAIDASPSPHRVQLQPTGVPPAFCAVHGQLPGAQHRQKNIRKICSCTALSVYQPQSASSSASGVKHLPAQEKAQPRSAAQPKPAHLAAKAASQPELLQLRSTSGTLAEAQSKSTPVTEEPAPRKSLLTLAEAAAAGSDADLPSAGNEQLPPAEAPAEQPSQSPASAVAAQASAQGLAPGKATAPDDAAPPAQQPPARPVRSGMTPEDTPFSKLLGLPAALHREAGLCGFHRPVKVTMQSTAAAAPAPAAPAPPATARHTVHATPLARQTHSQAGGAQLRLPVFGRMGPRSRKGSRQQLVPGSGSK